MRCMALKGRRRQRAIDKCTRPLRMGTNQRTAISVTAAQRRRVEAAKWETTGNQALTFQRKQNRSLKLSVP